MTSLRHQFAASRVAPAQTVDDFVGVRIDPDRRRGRGAETNRSGRFEPQEPRARRRRLGRRSTTCPPLKTEVQEETAAQDHHHQRIAGHLLRPVDQSLSRLRARLRLLLRAADARLYGPLARPRFRDEAVRQAERGASSSRRELAKPGYESRTMAIGTNTDPYQPIERRYRIMREVLEVLDAGQPSGRHRHQVGAGAPRHRHPVADGRAQPRQGGAVGDHARPASSPARWSRARRRRERRLDALRLLSEAGVPTTVMVAPIIPALNEPEIERILDAAAAAGVARGRLRAPPAAARGDATSSRSSSSATIPTAPSTSSR